MRGERRRISCTTVVTPSATSSARAAGGLRFTVPISSTTTLAPSGGSSPFWTRHKTFCVPSLPMPKFTAPSGSKCFAQMA